MTPAVGTIALLEPGKRARNKHVNRAAILDAARHCFLECGYEATSIRDVIRRTQLATGTFYNYFPDKESLLNALIKARMESLTEQLSMVRRTAQTMREFVHGAYLAAFSEVIRDPVLHTLLLTNERAINGVYDSSPLGISVTALRKDIADAIARGLMPETDIEYLAAVFYGAGYEMSRVLSESPQRSAEDAADFATRVFISGLNGLN